MLSSDLTMATNWAPLMGQLGAASALVFGMSYVYVYGSLHCICMYDTNANPNPHLYFVVCDSFIANIGAAYGTARAGMGIGGECFFSVSPTKSERKGPTLYTLYFSVVFMNELISRSRSLIYI